MFERNKAKIEFLYKDVKGFQHQSGIIGKNIKCFRIESFIERLKEIQLPYGESTLYIDGIYNSINDSIDIKSNSK